MKGKATFRIVCPQCRALNSTGDGRCLQCGAALERTEHFRRFSVRLGDVGIESRLSLAALALLIPALALTGYQVAQFIQGLTPAPQSLIDVIERELLASRIALFALLVAGWPALLVMSARLLDIRFPRPERVLALAGMAMGAMACLAGSLPWPGPLIAILFPLFLPILVLPPILKLRWGQAARLWFVQLCILAPLATFLLWGMESLLAGVVLNPAREMAPIVALARRAPLPPISLMPVPRGTTFPNVYWEPSASLWLERRANRVCVEAVNPEREENWSLSVLSVEFRGAYKSGRPETEGRRAVTFVPRTNSNYRISLDPAGVPGDLIVVHSLLPSLSR